MKFFLLSVFGSIIFMHAACQSSTQKKAKELKEAIDANTKASTAPGQFLTATIDGKQWTATEMVIDKDNTSIVQVHGKKGKTFMTFNLYKPAAGKEKSFSVNSPATWADDTDLDIYNGNSGQAVITKMDDQWIEGTFSFIGTHKDSGKEVKVTNGSFRVPNPKKFN